MEKDVFLISSHCCKKRTIFYTCALLPIFDNLISPPLRLLRYLGEKIGPWWECRHYEWKINTFNLQTEIAEKKKKHNIMLIIDKDLQFQYQQLAYCHDNVISRIFNPQVACLPPLSPSIWYGSLLSDSLLSWFYPTLVQQISSPIHMYASMEDGQHMLSFKARKSIKSFIKTKHHRSTLKNGRMQRESNRIGTCSPARCVHTNIAFLSKARSICRVIPGWWHVINAVAHLDGDACMFVTTKSQMQIAFAI